ncbi:MAG: hypothetical protein B1H12_05195 [Desulfobacteraceae bacterium 4484_190.2]|nr:MAG: hypothetical protein B1H12_05195 [Desulfobacteraceae bacterium 4484_190.2]
MKYKLRPILIITLALFIQTCSYSKNIELTSTRQPLPQNCEVKVYSPDEGTPENFEVFATVRFDDAGFSVSCSEDDVKEAMRIEACKIGANGIIIIKENFPSLLSTCYRATAKLVYVQNKP